MTRPTVAPVPFATLFLFISVLCGPTSHLHAQNANAPIVVRKNNLIEATTISCRRIALGEPEDYKPSVVQLPSGELLLVVFA